MERLHTSAEFPKDHPRNFYLLSVNDISELPPLVHPSSRNFGVLVAMDATEVDPDVIAVVATALIRRGLSYVCCWGPDCSAVHDIFDLAEVGLRISKELKHPGANDSLSSSWHDDESLQKAVAFFGKNAWPSGSFEKTTHDWFAVAVGHPEWEAIIRDEIAQGFPSTK